MAALGPPHEPSGEADHAQVDHHDEQNERDRDEEELVEESPRKRPRHGRRLQVITINDRLYEREPPSLSRPNRLSLV